MFKRLIIFNVDGRFRAAFLQPNITGNAKCRFQVIKTTNKDIFYGVCQLEGIQYTDIDIYNTIKNGS